MLGCSYHFLYTQMASTAAHFDGYLIDVLVVGIGVIVCRLVGLLLALLTHTDCFQSKSLARYVIVVVIVVVRRHVRLLISFLIHVDGFHSSSLLRYLVDVIIVTVGVVIG